MTELEERAKQYVDEKADKGNYDYAVGDNVYFNKSALERAYVAGAKGNWHNIKKNPADLPSPYRNYCSKAVITDKHHIAYYDHSDGFWYDWDQDFQLMADIVAWCDFPRYEE